MSILFNCEYDDFSVLKLQDTESPSQVTTTKIIITPTFQRKRPKPRKENAKINNPSRNLKIQFFFFFNFLGIQSNPINIFYAIPGNGASEISAGTVSRVCGGVSGSGASCCSEVCGGEEQLDGGISGKHQGNAR